MRLIFMLGLLSACASSAAPVRSLPIPAPLEVPAGQALVLEARARGVQVYQCRPTSDPGKFEWTLTGPEAELFDVAGKPIGMHSAGPAWQVSDGSKVVGEVKAKAAGPDPGAIPWLLLAAKSTEGPGILARTASIQRLETVGGKAPSDGCSRDREGAVVRVDYKATYRFYRKE